MTQERRADAAFVIAILAGVLFIAFLGPLGRRLEMVHQNDFSGIWSGPATVLAGVSPWDPVRYDATDSPAITMMNTDTSRSVAAPPSARRVIARSRPAAASTPHVIRSGTNSNTWSCDQL